MDNLEKLPEVFANGLFIRREIVLDEEDVLVGSYSATKIIYIPAPDSTKALFKKLMRDHISYSLQRCQAGFSISYNYYIGQVRGSRIKPKEPVLARTINKNLQDILEALPELEGNEEYSFPKATAASIRVIGFDNAIPLTQVHRCSSWVASTLANM